MVCCLPLVFFLLITNQGYDPRTKTKAATLRRYLISHHIHLPDINNITNISEVVKVFEWASTNTRRHPTSVLQGVDGSHIDNNVVITYLVLTSVTLIQKGT